ncbi:MAG: hypothetical protein R3185_05710 [Candidatus Thermoplasmatota archaeon]|nr:hypothetical protein [Candidatus Thermoplasmatota archaeon]
MALPSPTTLAVLASAIVAVLSAVMAYLGYRSYQRTRNSKLVFIVVAFLVFILKSAFVAYNVTAHVVPHDTIEFVSAVFDLAIVFLLFIPFFLKAPR